MKKRKIETQFVVSEQQLDEKAVLDIAILNAAVTATSEAILETMEGTYQFECNAYELKLLADAKLNDRLIVRGKVMRFNTKSLVLKVSVFKVAETTELCLATGLFSYAVEEALPMAS